MAVHLARRPLGPPAERTSRRNRTGSSTRVSGVAFTALAYAAYVAVLAALVVHLTPATAEIYAPGSDLSAKVDGPVVSEEAAVLTISVDGPDDSADVLCATTTDRAPFGRLHVSPEQVMDAFQQWCSPAQPVTGE